MSLVLAGDGVSVNPFNGRPAWLTLGGFWIIKQNIFFLKFRNPSVSRSYLEIDGGECSKGDYARGKAHARFSDLCILVFFSHPDGPFPPSPLSRHEAAVSLKSTAV